MRTSFSPLGYHFKTISGMAREVTLTFKRMESILGVPLPAFAKCHLSWWHNEPQATIWRSAGFKVDLVHLQVDMGFVRFKREQTEPKIYHTPVVQSQVAHGNAGQTNEAR
ncbi:MAG: hypothetical protein JWR21_94 [Herminiimonas sp.]|nr:hypothetical protein [Herminiimonas sp.]